MKKKMLIGIGTYIVLTIVLAIIGYAGTIDRFILGNEMGYSLMVFYLFIPIIGAAIAVLMTIYNNIFKWFALPYMVICSCLLQKWLFDTIGALPIIETAVVIVIGIVVTNVIVVRRKKI